MYEYIKIPAIFKRDESGRSKNVLEGVFRHEDIRYLYRNEWICTEKVDGMNLVICYDGHSVSFQGRTERAQIPRAIEDKLLEYFGGCENEELFEQKFGNTSIVLYGEGYGKKYHKSDDIILFDAYLPELDLWLTRESLEDIARTFGVDAVPVILRGKLEDAVSYVKSKPASSLGSAPMEGLVCVPATNMRHRNGARIIVKVKACDFN